MKDILFTDGTETMYEAVGIDVERANYLFYRMESIIHELFRPTPDGHISWADSQILKLFTALAETDEERVFLAYYAGQKALILEMQYSDDEDYHKE